MVLSKKHQDLVALLTELTESDKINWTKYNTPTSFIYQPDGTSFAVDVFYSIVGEDKKKESCVELTIIKDGRIFEDLVFCNIQDYKDDFELLIKLYNTVKSKYTQRSDSEISLIYQSLSQPH